MPLVSDAIYPRPPARNTMDPSFLPLEAHVPLVSDAIDRQLDERWEKTMMQAAMRVFL